jgi:hypothetical protein
MNIAVGKSTYAFMVADPLAILEENEIHLGFSSNFRDPKDGWEQVLLHETDVLVARLPAVLSSDVQKAGFASARFISQMNLFFKLFLTSHYFLYHSHGFLMAALYRPLYSFLLGTRSVQA